MWYRLSLQNKGNIYIASIMVKVFELNAFKPDPHGTKSILHTNLCVTQSHK